MKWTISDKVSNPIVENLEIKFDPPDEIAYAFERLKAKIDAFNKVAQSME